MSTRKIGYYKGRHYSSYITEVVNLKLNGELDKAEKLLLGLIKATEDENNAEGLGVAPWYYEQLAIIYRKQKKFEKEISILERYSKQKPPIQWDISQPLPTDPPNDEMRKSKDSSK